MKSPGIEPTTLNFEKSMKQTPDQDIRGRQHRLRGQPPSSLEDLLAGRVRVLADILADITSTVGGKLYSPTVILLASRSINSFTIWSRVSLWVQAGASSVFRWGANADNLEPPAAEEEWTLHFWWVDGERVQ